MKKVICLMLIIVLSFGMVSGAFANTFANNRVFSIDGERIVIVKDNNEIRIVHSYKDGIKNIIEYDKKKGTLNTIALNKNGKELSSEKIKLSHDLTSRDNKLISLKSSNKQHTFSNYEYDTYYFGSSWRLRHPDYSSVYISKDANQDDLDLVQEYQGIVNDINAYEWTVIGCTSISVLSALIDLLFTKGWAASKVIAVVGPIGYDGARNLWNSWQEGDSFWVTQIIPEFN